MDRQAEFPILPAELECLKVIGEHVIRDPARCPQPALQGLLTKGLIEQVVQLWLPLEMRQTAYRPTDLGWRVLKGAQAGGRS